MPRVSRIVLIHRKPFLRDGGSRLSEPVVRKARRPGGLLIFLALLLVASSSCGGPPQALDLKRPADAPAVYRVSAVSEASFSGPVSDLEGKTTLTAAFEVLPVSPTAVEVEVIYLAASVEDASGEPAALGLGAPAGKKARVEFGPAGQVSRVEGDRDLLQARIPLMSVPDLVENLFPPLPGEETRVGDTWNGNVPVSFPNLGDAPARALYTLTGADQSSGAGTVEGHGLGVEPRSFRDAGVSGRGDLDLIFEGDYDARTGYTHTERTTRFDSASLRLGGGNLYANGNVRLEQTVTTELLNPAERFGLDAG